MNAIFLHIDLSFFQIVAMSVLLCDFTTWKNVDGNYTRMLCVVLNKSLQQHLPKQQLGRTLPFALQTIQIRGARHVGHCWRSKDKLVSNIFLWTPTYGHTSIDQPAKTYLSSLCRHWIPSRGLTKNDSC